MASLLMQQRNNRVNMIKKVSEDLDGNNSYQNGDDRFWKLTRDKSGTGSAVIRFLPATGTDELPWVKTYSYAFKGPTGKWYINESPSTIGGKDPVMESNAILYNSGFESDKVIAKNQKRGTKYIYNILVIKDPANPDNDGKVFLFKGGKSIHDMILAKAKPQFEDDVPVFVYDLWEGANFKLRIVTEDKYPTYKNSMFDSPTALYGGNEEKLEDVLSKCHRLGEFTDPGRFKSYDQLKKEFDRVANGAAVPSAAEQMDDEEYQPQTSRVSVEKLVKEKPVQAPVERVEKVEKIQVQKVVEDDSDSDLDYFTRLLNDT